MDDYTLTSIALGIRAYLIGLGWDAFDASFQGSLVALIASAFVD